MQEKDQKHVCKFCYKSFPCGRSLGGHMRSHDHQKSDPNNKIIKTISNQHSSNASTDHHNKQAALCKKNKRSKRYDATTNSSPSLIDHQDQQEVALSLILLSMDSIVESSSEAVKLTSAKEVETESRGPFAQTKRLKKRVSSDDFFESEVNSPKCHEFGSELDKATSKFRCVICKKGFPSYQALGGHRASHKKFKGCCAPTTENTLQTEKNSQLFEQNKSKDHECPICFKVFQSGQALGGHKRSHILAHQSKTRVVPQIRDFLDLNLPAPVEADEANEFKPWWNPLISSS